MIKLVVTDLDGTMFDKDEQLLDFATKLSGELLQRGVLFCFATGRSMASARCWIERLGITIPCVVNNGALIADSDSVLESHTFRAITLREVLLEADAQEMSVILCGEQVGEDTPMRLTPYVERYQQAFGLYRKISRPTETEWEAMQLQKITIIDDLKRVDAIHQKLLTIPEVSSIYYGAGGMEIMPAGCDKATGVRQLCQHLGISLSEVLAIGNDANDVGMLQVCGVGAVVANGYISAKKHADYLCKDSFADGVLEAITVFC